MRSFLLKNGTPICPWGSIKENTLYKGRIPDGYDLAVTPSPGYIIVDVDNKNGKNGSKNIPVELQKEFDETFSYPTKNGGFHYWFKYTGKETLPNTTSKLSIDLRVGPREGNAGGYVKWHPRHELDVRDYVDKMNPTSDKLNEWLENIFIYKS